MNSRTMLALIALALAAAPARAAEPAKWPAALVDVDCEDDDGSDASGNVSLVDGTTTRVTESAGSSNGKCDSDNRILTGAQTADVLLGPFNTDGRAEMDWFIFDGDSVTGGSTTWSVCLMAELPHEPASIPPLASQLRIESCATAITGNQADLMCHVGSIGTTVSHGTAPANPCNIATTVLPRPYWLLLDVAGGVGSTSGSGATSWTGSVSKLATD